MKANQKPAIPWQAPTFLYAGWLYNETDPNRPKGFLTQEDHNVIYAPWTIEQVASIKAFQESGAMMYCCPHGVRESPRYAAHGNFGKTEALSLLPARWGLICPYCAYTQDFVHEWTTNPARWVPIIEQNGDKKAHDVHITMPVLIKETVTQTITQGESWQDASLLSPEVLWFAHAIELKLRATQISVEQGVSDKRPYDMDLDTIMAEMDHLHAKTRRNLKWFNTNPLDFRGMAQKVEVAAELGAYVSLAAYHLAHGAGAFSRVPSATMADAKMSAIKHALQALADKYGPPTFQGKSGYNWIEGKELPDPNDSDDLNDMAKTERHTQEVAETPSARMGDLFAFVTEFCDSPSARVKGYNPSPEWREDAKIQIQGLIKLYGPDKRVYVDELSEWAKKYPIGHTDYPNENPLGILLESFVLPNMRAGTDFQPMPQDRIAQSLVQKFGETTSSVAPTALPQDPQKRRIIGTTPAGYAVYESTAPAESTIALSALRELVRTVTAQKVKEDAMLRQGPGGGANQRWSNSANDQLTKIAARLADNAVITLSTLRGWADQSPFGKVLSEWIIPPMEAQGAKSQP